MQFEDKVINALKSHMTTGLFRRCLQEYLFATGHLALEPRTGLLLYRGHVAWWF